MASPDDQAFYKLLRQRIADAEKLMQEKHAQLASAQIEITQAERALVALREVFVTQGFDIEKMPSGLAKEDEQQTLMDAAPPSMSGAIAPPSVSEGIIQMIVSSGERGVSLKELYIEFQRRGWLNPDNKQPEQSLRAALNRVVRADPDKYVRQGGRAYLRSALPEVLE